MITFDTVMWFFAIPMLVFAFFIFKDVIWDPWKKSKQKCANEVKTDE